MQAKEQYGKPFPFVWALTLRLRNGFVGAYLARAVFFGPDLNDRSGEA
jgi:hypothetical protein